jgi:hypothetical protein
MHPRPDEHVCFLQSLAGACGAVVLAVGLLGCEPSAPRPTSPFAPAASIGEPSSVERDSALSVLASMRRTAFDSAFDRLSEYAHTRRTRTVQIGASGEPTARRSQTVRYEAGGTSGTVVSQADSGGAFEAGPFDAFVSTPDPTAPLSNLAQQAFPDNPAYLSARTREAFRYRVRDDAYRGEPVSVVTVQARASGEGREQSVRYAELTIHRDTGELLAARTVRAERILLFSEDSRLVVRLRLGPDGTWLPHESRFHARVDVPFRAPQEFRTVSTYTYSLLGN